MASQRKMRTAKGGGILGYDAFVRISAIEGIVIGPDVRALFQKFDREGLSRDERRRVVVRMFAHKS